jgi:hypothetical protein
MKVFKDVPVTKGYDRATIAYLEVFENELDFLSLDHGATMSSIKTHNTYGCYIADNGQWAYYVRYPNETKWEQVY